MITWLFGTSIIYDLLSIAFIALLIFLCFKFPETRKVIFSLLVVIYVAFTGYFAFQLNAYYSLEGGVYGFIKKQFETENKFEVTEYGFSYKINNIKFKKETEDMYSASIVLSDIVNLKKDKNYSVFVNDVQCYNAKVNDKYITSEYTYQFLNDESLPVFVDTLYMNIAMNDYDTTMKVYTKGGQQAVDYWYNYYSKNEFLIEIKESDFVLNNKLAETDGKLENYYVVKFYVNENLYLSQYVKKNENFTLPQGPSLKDFSFVGWKNSKDNLIYKNTFMASSDLTFYGEYSYNFEMSKLFLSEEQENELTEKIKQTTVLGSVNKLISIQYSETEKELKVIYGGLSGKGIPRVVIDEFPDINSELNYEFILSLYDNESHSLTPRIQTIMVKNDSEEFYNNNIDNRYKVDDSIFTLNDIYVKFTFSFNQEQPEKDENFCEYSLVFYSPTSGLKMFLKRQYPDNPLTRPYDYNKILTRILEPYRIH